MDSLRFQKEFFLVFPRIILLEFIQYPIESWSFERLSAEVFEFKQPKTFTFFLSFEFESWDATEIHKW